MNGQPVVIILATGRGLRFTGGVQKLAQPFGSSTVLGTTLGHVIESQLPLLVVTTEVLAPQAARLVALRDILTLPVSGNAGLDGGMGESIAAGVAARANAGGWLVLPADMPLVRPDTIAQVGAALAQHPAVYAQHRGRRGHPVGFAAELYSDLAHLVGDDGARRVLARYPSHGVEVDDPGVLLDVDTEQDLATQELHVDAQQQAGGPLRRGRSA